MFDLQFLALQTDLTRVVTFMLGREQSIRSYPQVGVSDAHHPLSHHENDPVRIELMSKIDTYHVQLVSKYFDPQVAYARRLTVTARYSIT